MEKKNLILIIIAIGIFIFLNSNKFEEKKDLGFGVHYYNENKKEIFASSPYFSFDILGNNRGNVKISNIQLVDASPEIFKNSLIQQQTELEIGDIDKILFSSNLLSDEDLRLLPQPVKFWIRISGRVGQQILEREAYLFLTFGDYSKFRTTNLAYSSGSISFTKTCGTELIRKDYLMSGNFVNSCDETMLPFGFTKQHLVPCSVSDDCALYLHPTITNTVYICSDKLKQYFTYYNAGNPLESNQLINPLMEVGCNL